MRGEEQTLATRRRRSAVPPPSLGDVLSDALARAQTAKPARAKKGGKSCPVSRVASGLFAGSEFDNNCSSSTIVGGGAASQAASNNCSSSTVVGRAAAAEAVPPSHPLLGDGIEADDLLIEIASWLTAAECRALAACRLRFHALASFTGQG